jgi:hypothetical protein
MVHPLVQQVVALAQLAVRELGDLAGQDNRLLPRSRLYYFSAIRLLYMLAPNKEATSALELALTLLSEYPADTGDASPTELATWLQQLGAEVRDPKARSAATAEAARQFVELGTSSR